MPPKIEPTFEHFERAPESFRALSLELPADLETPVTAYLKVSAAARARGAQMGFLLESAERGETLGRYSFIAAGVQSRIELSATHATVFRPGAAPEVHPLMAGDPLAVVREVLGSGDGSSPTVGEPPRGSRAAASAAALVSGQPAGWPAGGAGAPPLLGGAVGYLGYDFVRHFERLPQTLPDVLGLPGGILLLPETVLVFDHARRVMRLVSLLSADGSARERYDDAARRIEELRAALAEPLPSQPVATAPSRRDSQVGSDGGRVPPPQGSSDAVSNFTQAGYEAAVERVKEHIRAGDIFQLVLSQRFTGETDADPFQIYRALRLLNPSPYMFFLDFGELKLIGSSPETQVQLSRRRARLNPIAGTRPRGATAEEDGALAAELLADEKELAEHVMLVDLARNDLGRVAATGSVSVPQFKHVERYSHVMHLVSSVEAELADGLDAFGLFSATFPAGTVSGAPKVRAMELIEALEPSRRGPYAGAVGYFGADGEMDTCIAIRTIVMQGRRYNLQAGAGIVADSDPRREYEETLAKMEALKRAIALAEEGL